MRHFIQTGPIMNAMAKNQKYYVVWKGRTPGIYSTWDDCSAQVTGYPGAQYKAFDSREAAESAYRGQYADYKGKAAPRTIRKFTPGAGQPTIPSYAVDAACAGNPGPLEYRCVHTETGEVVFQEGPYARGTNNVGEFLAIVHTLMRFTKEGIALPIYSDSKIAIGWVADKHCKTTLVRESANAQLFTLIRQAEQWLANSHYPNSILHWQTEAWGEIPADFGRK